MEFIHLLEWKRILIIKIKKVSTKILDNQDRDRWFFFVDISETIRNNLFKYFGNLFRIHWHDVVIVILFQFFLS